MLASDINNPEYQGAISNPDSRLSVKFYNKAVQNNFRTEKEGRPIFEDVTFVRITLPGDTNNIIDTFARDEHKSRFPLQWAHYKNTHGDDQQMIGTPLSSWPLLTTAQAEELKALKFYTVEQIAGASDLQLQKLGMLAGMSPYAFRDRAAKYLSIAKNEADATQADSRVKQLEEENAKLKAETEAKMEAMQAQMALLMEAVGNRQKPGRKPKSESESSDSEAQITE